MQNKSILSQLIIALFALMPTITLAQESTQLAKWTFDTGYTVADGVYTPNADSWTEVSTKWFKDGQPTIVANEAVGNAADYTLTGKTARYWAITTGYNNQVFRIVNDTEANNITDLTDPSQHNNYYEVRFPTTGYKDIQMELACSYGGNANATLNAVVSVDGGQTWATEGTYTTASGWWIYDVGTLRISAQNKEQVIVRLIFGNDFSSNWNLDYLTISGEAATTFVDMYALNTAVSPAGAGSVSRAPSGTEYEAGTQVALSATANLGYTFAAWTDAEGNILSTENPYTVTINAATDIVATFDQEALPEGTAVTLANWNIEQGYDVAENIYTPNGSEWTASAATWFNQAPAPIIRPDSQMGSADDFVLTAWSENRYWQLCDGYQNHVLRIENNTANNISDYTDAAQHNAYYEIQFPTIGYKDVTVDFACAWGKNEVATLEAVVSTDGGQTWFDAGAYETMGNWWLYKDNTVQLSAANKEKVILRLIAGNGFASNWNLNYIKVNAVVAGAPVSEQVNEQDFTLTWPLKEGANSATTAQAIKEGVFSVAEMTVGDNLIMNGTRTDGGILETMFQPTEQAGSQEDVNAITFTMKPKKGLTVTPKSFAFHASRVGTNGGNFDVVAFSGGQRYVIATDERPQLVKESPYYTAYEYDLTSIPTTDDILEIKIYIRGLATNKQYAFSDVVFLADVEGAIEAVSAYTLNVSLGTEGAGKISTNPAGNEFDEGTRITVSASENFGYHFAAWVDEQGETVSTENPYSFDINENTTLIATYTKNNVFALNLTRSEGVNDNLVQYAPIGNVVDGVHYYEEGTDVKLTAINNRILTFTGWEGDAQGTAQECELKMTGEKNVTANFSAADYIVGWDLYYDQPSRDRAADYKAESDNAGMLTVRQADGTTSSWLTRGIGNGLENGKYAARIWKYLSEEWYWEISFSSKGYENLSISSCIGDDYNTYSVNNVQYSIDGQTFTTIGTFNPPARGWDGPKEFALPEDANDQQRVWIRWMPDRTSDKIGVASDYDGTSIAEIFVLADQMGGSEQTATLVSTTPAEGADDVSANGSIILTFDNKITAGQGYASLDGEEIAPIISGKTAIFRYSGLKYGTQYTFTMPEGVIVSRSGNAVAAVTLNFTTMERQQPEMRLYDAVVDAGATRTTEISGIPVYQTVQAAIDAAPVGSAKPWLIFVKNGRYNEHVDMPANKPNLHLIGQERNNAVILDNRLCGGDNAYSVDPGATVVVKGADAFFENLTIENSYGYEQLAGPQALALNTQADRVVLNNVALLSYQDTWITTSTQKNRHYIKNSLIEGAVDFIYNGGNVYLDGDTLQINRPSGGYIVAPRHTADTKWGYVFMNNIIRPRPGINVTDVWFGRPWHDEPKTVFINTQTFINIPAKGWYNTMGGLPALWADYNTVDANGNPVDLSQRETYYYYIDSNTGEKVEKFNVKNYLTDEEAAQYTIKNVMGGDDNWQPDLKCEACDAPEVKINNGKIVWNAVPYAICYVITKDGEVIDFTIETSYDYVEGAEYKVQAANEFGGLSKAIEPVVVERGVVLTDVDTEAPAAGTYATVTYERTLFVGLNTLVLPFETTKDEIGATYVLTYTGTTEDDGVYTLNFQEVSDLEANVPYAVIIEGEDISLPVFENKTIVEANDLTVSDDNFSYVGTYTDFGKNNSVVKNGDYVAGATKFKKATGGNRVAAYRAYFKNHTGNSAAKLAFNFAGVVMDDDNVSEDGGLLDGINQAAADASNSEIYNLQGICVKKATKGVYIQNGKKVVVK